MKDSVRAVFWCADFGINQGEASLLINTPNNEISLGSIFPRKENKVRGLFHIGF